MAHIVGVVQLTSLVAPWGTFLSFNLKNALTKACQKGDSTKRSWWTRHRIYLSKMAIATISQLMDTLLIPERDPLWCHPIHLFVI